MYVNVLGSPQSKIVLSDAYIEYESKAYTLIAC